MTSQMNSSPDNGAKKKEYHAPKLRNFGKVSDLTLTSPGNPGDPTDGGGGLDQYSS